MFYGAHCSTAGGVYMALRRAKMIGASLCQVFVKNNMQWFGKPFSPEDLAALCEGTGRELTSPASSATRVTSSTSAGRRPRIAIALSSRSFRRSSSPPSSGFPFWCCTPVRIWARARLTGIKQIVAGLDEVFAATKRSPVRIALENTAGQGTCLGNKIEHLAAVFDGVKKPERLGVCLDTAHFFAAGYDIRTPKGWNAAIREVASLVGLKQILAFHLNDSKTDLGSRVDRHDHIGKGKIGKEAFRHIVNDARFKKHPGCLETPKSEDLHEDVQNLAALRALVKAG